MGDGRMNPGWSPEKKREIWGRFDLRRKLAALDSDLREACQCAAGNTTYEPTIDIAFDLQLARERMQQMSETCDTLREDAYAMQGKIEKLAKERDDLRTLVGELKEIIDEIGRIRSSGD